MARKKPLRKTVIPTFSQIDAMTYADIRKTYSKLRTVFNKRIARAVAAGMGAARYYDIGGAGFFPKLENRFKALGERDLTKEEKTLALSYDVKELVNLMQGGVTAPLTISQAKQFSKDNESKILATLHDSGYEHISKSTLRSFGRFMDQMRVQYGRKLPNSEEMAEFFESLKYNTKRRSTKFIVDVWKEFEKNGYQPSNGNEDLFAT